MMQGYREFREFRVLASYSAARICVMDVAGEDPWLLLHWEIPTGTMTGDFFLLVQRAQRRSVGYVALAMEADAKHILRETGTKRAYRVAARAHAGGLMTRKDLANIGIGLTSEQREAIGLNVLGELAS